ncbi:hypothetical protein JCM8547_004363 [Rhodosporidiobolus lusitaniae]
MSSSALPPSSRHPLAHLDLYAALLLSSSPRPTAHEVKQAYRALILRHHPDRMGASELQGEGEGTRAEEVNRAWEVLGDEEKRGEYDRARAAYLAATRAARNSSAYAVSLSLDIFEPHYPPSSPSLSSPSPPDDEPAYYTHPCRCSSQFRITREELESGVEVVGCEGCSERCRVEYEVVVEE